jgi:uncharacterized membrane protein
MPSAFILALHVLCAAAWVGATLFFAFLFAGAARSLAAADALEAARAALRPYRRLAWALIALLALSGAAAAVLEAGASGSISRVATAKLPILVALGANHAFACARYARSLLRETALAPEIAIAQWRRYLLLQRVNAVVGLLLIVLSLAAD